jgi:hypothetical protein
LNQELKAKSDFEIPRKDNLRVKTHGNLNEKHRLDRIQKKTKYRKKFTQIIFFFFIKK